MKYRKKPVVIDAFQFTGKNQFEVMRWCDAVHSGPAVTWEFHDGVLDIPTMEGVMTANPNDWIIRGVKGEFYPCKPDIFEATYEPAEGREL